MAGNHRFCVGCQCKHASPTGKKCQRPILELVADAVPVIEGAVGGDLPDQPEILDFNDIPGAALGNISHDINNDHFDTLLSVVSDFASRVDATQRRLDALHLTAPLAQPSDTGAVTPAPSSGAVPKRPACASGHSCAASADVHGSLPHLQDLRADARAVAQANNMVDCLETTIQGNSVRALRRGWSRLGGTTLPGWPYHGHRTSLLVMVKNLASVMMTSRCLSGLKDASPL
jgi:hypothetical protein